MTAMLDTGLEAWLNGSTTDENALLLARFATGD